MKQQKMRGGREADREEGQSKGWRERRRGGRVGWRAEQSHNANALLKVNIKT